MRSARSARISVWRACKGSLALSYCHIQVAYGYTITRGASKNAAAAIQVQYSRCGRLRIKVRTQRPVEKSDVTYNFQVPAFPEILYNVLPGAALGCLYKGLDDAGETSMEIKAKIIIKGRENLPITMRDCFSGITFDPTSASPLYEFFTGLRDNDRAILIPSQIELEGTILPGRRSARITKVDLLDSNNQPRKANEQGRFDCTVGDELKVQAELQYYNSKAEQRVINIVWPKDDKQFPAGSYVLQVRGGYGLNPLFQDVAPAYAINANLEAIKFFNYRSIPAPRTTDDLIEMLTDRNENDQLLIELINTNEDLRDKATGKLPRHLIVQVPKANYIVHGFARFDLDVKEKAKK